MEKIFTKIFFAEFIAPKKLGMNLRAWPKRGPLPLFDLCRQYRLLLAPPPAFRGPGIKKSNSDAHRRTNFEKRPAFLWDKVKDRDFGENCPAMKRFRAAQQQRLAIAPPHLLFFRSEPDVIFCNGRAVVPGLDSPICNRESGRGAWQANASQLHANSFVT